MNRYSTFVQYPDQINRLKRLRPELWLLEHPAFSLRSGVPDEDPSDFGRLRELVSELNGQAALAVQTDLMLRDPQFAGVDRFLDELEALEIDTVRVQDFGLFKHLLDHRQFRLQLNPETGGCTVPYWKHFQDRALSRLTLCHIPDQCTLENAELISRHMNAAVEVLGHGPLMMYQSHRRVFHDTGHTWLQEEKRADQRFLLEMDRHGTRVFHSYPRWTLPLIHDGALDKQFLLLMDFRQASLHEQEALIEIYLETEERESVSSRAKVAAFIKTNDQNWLKPRVDKTERDDDMVSPVYGPAAAEVVHRDSTGYLLLQAVNDLEFPVSGRLVAQDGFIVPFVFKGVKDHHDDWVKQVAAGQLFRIPLQTGMASGALMILDEY